MTLIRSISGIRGTIGGKPGEGLTPFDILKYSASFGTWVLDKSKNDCASIVVGRDARVSGEMVNHLVVGTLLSLGIDVIDIGLATTPTVEIAVTSEKADAGIIITASHNPGEWNALKLLNNYGEFITDFEGKKVIEIAENGEYKFKTAEKIGKYFVHINYHKKHIEKILELELVDSDSIKKADFSVVIDCVNSVGGIALPDLLDKLGVKKVYKLYCEPNGIFPHNPEPLPENLQAISEAMIKLKADIGFVVDPDVDRLAIVNEDGTMFGEEYTLVAVADYILSHKKGNTVSNLSSTRALQDVTEKYGGKYSASAVGEVNVVEMMKNTNAVIGGEGNGGVIYPDLHYGRDALAGIALFLSHLAKKKIKCSELRKIYPSYYISKNKIHLTESVRIDKILDAIKQEYASCKINEADGIRIDFPDGWVHLRKSNTEPIIRVYAEHRELLKADELANKLLRSIKNHSGL
jgi:phosphomannomutase